MEMQNILHNLQHENNSLVREVAELQNQTDSDNQPAGSNQVQAPIGANGDTLIFRPDETLETDVTSVYGANYNLQKKVKKFVSVIENLNRTIDKLRLDVAILKETNSKLASPEVNNIVEQKVQAGVKKNISAEKRRSMVNWYKHNQNGFLDYAFFADWGVYPVRVKGKNVIRKGDIEIIAHSNAEFKRGHIKYELTPEQVYQGDFHICGETKSGIYVIGSGMKDSKYLKY
ncbi:hypothetical protein SAMN04488587_1527 [Methanococcoides vulcani]|uniref:Uncharacterized protein n=1 Tax=Methanococcoides vulcani TaxID=1353158 RepID=A0A1I0AA97_9EURY|nr:hypothetical protein [Methanococcoides vulcani]SES91129.1 hypothetical protein SAMN04488587_1527 [Methanococcoides vulcani]